MAQGSRKDIPAPVFQADRSGTGLQLRLQRARRLESWATTMATRH
jgi:hypothetical protein